MQTYIVGMQGTDWIKIGKTTNMECRLKTLQTGNPHLLTVLWLHDGDMESELHAIFDPFRVHGEWFTVGSTVAQRRLANVMGASDGG